MDVGLSNPKKVAAPRGGCTPQRHGRKGMSEELPPSSLHEVWMEAGQDRVGGQRGHIGKRL